MATIQQDNSANSEQNKRQSRNINKKIDILDKKIDSLYKDIYISRTDNRKNLDDIINSIDDTIDKLQGVETSASGLTELLRRVERQDKTNTGKFLSSVTELFENENLVGSVIINDETHQFIRSQNYNYDLICKYLPRLQDALEIKRDNVLCSDNFDKEFLVPQSPSVSKKEIDAFNSNVDKIEVKYDMSEFLDDTYMNTSKYGEDFIYVVPYPVAFKRMFDRARKRQYAPTALSPTTVFEGYEEVKDVICEKFNGTEEFKTFGKSIEDKLEGSLSETLKDLPEFGAINLYFNPTNMIESSVEEIAVFENQSQVERFKSLYSVYESGSGLTSVFNDAIAKDSKGNKIGTLYNDGFVLDKNLDRDPDKIDKNMLGAVLERIPRENILPIYIGKRCLGYYYFEFADDPSACGFCGGHHMLPGLGMTNGKYTYDMTEDQKEMAIRFIASKISDAIDTKFINANKDLKEDIYALLRYNEKFDIGRTNNVGVTFLPAEDIIHCYFKMDWNIHRGISDLENALVPAMLYILLYLTDIIGKLTRSVDKRVYYVKQNVEQNIARTLMNTVNQIKKGNMGIRQIESMNNILNIVGKYNDYLIPVGPSGDPPIQFDIMQGQDIQTPTDMMDKMEEAAVNTIMPYELVNATYQQDFATRFTMSNTRFLRTIFTRQRKTEGFFEEIYTRVYNYEFGTKYLNIEITLPPPLFLVLQNNSQLIDNISQMADKITDVEMISEKDEEIKPEFKRLYIRKNLSNYLDFAMIDRLIAQAKVNIETAKDPAVEETDENPEDMMNDEL